MSNTAREIHDKVVTELIQAIPAKWLRLIASYEIQESEETIDQSSIVVYVFDEGSGPQAKSLESLPESIEAAFRSLHRSSTSSEQGKWKSAEVTVDHDGSYRFMFSHDSPKRLNGIFDDDSYGKFNRCAEVYGAEKALARS